MTSQAIRRESQHRDLKSIRAVIGHTANYCEIANDCVGFANNSGGTLFLGIEDDADAPPPMQRIDPTILDQIRKRIGELTVNVQVAAKLTAHDNGGEYIELAISRSAGIASTSDGRYFLRVGDTSRRIVGDDVLGLIRDRPAVPWEEMISLGVSASMADAAKLASLCAGLRASDRVKQVVKEKTDEELLEHYSLSSSGILTNLGVLLVGGRHDRACLGTSSIVQAIKYDENHEKIDKWCWDDHTLSPIELIDDIWSSISDFRESYELDDGLFRTKLPAYEERVIREVLVNAIVHRPYTQHGDIFLNLHPDRLEIVNPGRLPVGITPQNILHGCRRRNEGLARVFHDVKLMEREGTGIDLLYERTLGTGRKAPTVREGTDSVHVTVPRRVLKRGVIKLLNAVEKQFQLTQRERISLSLIAQNASITTGSLSEALDLSSENSLRSWLGRLLEWGLVESSGG
ncbi:MAG: putative DNA binding domain-containing protein, partial [Polyangiaceae bacterium]|nr:putative DNA binding domain-containing protein [Polyangiaceae bacterium]